MPTRYILCLCQRCPTHIVACKACRTCTWTAPMSKNGLNPQQSIHLKPWACQGRRLINQSWPSDNTGNQPQCSNPNTLMWIIKIRSQLILSDMEVLESTKMINGDMLIKSGHELRHSLMMYERLIKHLEIRWTCIYVKRRTHQLENLLGNMANRSSDPQWIMHKVVR